jgi:Tol biopolymer transport system component
MISGDRPFPGETVVLITEGILHRRPRPVSRIKPGTPLKLDKNNGDCLEKDAHLRLQTARELHAQLQDTLRMEISAGYSLPVIGPASWENWRFTTGIGATLVLLVVMLLFGASSLGWITFTQVASSTPRQVPLTTLEGNEYGPSFSPEGTRIVFVRNIDTNRKSEDLDIWMKSVEGEQINPLTSDPAPEYSPIWSPDDKYIAYFRREGRSAEIRLIELRFGYQDKRIGETASTNLDSLNWQACWSPDSESIYFPDIPEAGEPKRIFRLFLRNSKKDPVTNPAKPYSDWSPALSPDGKNLAFARGEIIDQADCYLKALPGGEERPLAKIHAPIETIVWISDTVLLVSGWDMDVLRIDISSGVAKRVPNLRGVSSFSYDRIGRRLATGRNSAEADIWEYDIGRKSSRKLIFSSQLEKDPQYSPKGDAIAYASDSYGADNIFRCDPEGSNKDRLTRSETGDSGSPRWSPNGESIAFDSQQDGKWGIWTIGAYGGPEHRLTSREFTAVRPSWSHDGNHLYFSSSRSGENQIWRQSVAGSDLYQVTKQGGFEAFESSNSKYVYYTKGYEDPVGLWRVPLGGGLEELVSDEIRQGDWALFGNSAFYLDRDGKLKQLDLETRQSRPIAELGRAASHWLSGFCISPDGRRVLYQRFDEGESDLNMLLDFE